MKRLNKYSIKNEVFLLGLVSSLTILLVFGFLLTTGFFSISINSARQSIRDTNLQINIFTDRFFSEITTTIDILAGNDDIRNLLIRDDQAAERALSIYKNVLEANEDILYVYSGHENGLLLINDYTPPDGFDPTTRPWYLAALDYKPLTATGVPYREANSDEWVIAPSRVLIDDNGNLSGVIAIDITLEGVVAMLAQRHLFPSQRSFIVDKDGLVLIHPDENMIGEKFNVFDMNNDSPQGELDYLGEDGQLWAHYSTIDSTGWVLVTDVERREIMAPIIRQILGYILLIIILAVLIGLLMSKVFGRRFADPLLELGSRVSAITTGKSVEPMARSHSNYEIIKIAQNIEKLAEHSLNKKANELQTIIESTKEGILVVSMERTVVYVNSRFKEMWRIDDAIIESREEKQYIEAVHDQLEEPEAFFENNDLLYDTARSETGETYFKDGRVFERFSTPLHDNGELAGRLWSFRDITESKKAEKQIKYQNEFLKLIAEISADFINTTSDNIDERIDSMFARCGVFLEVDRVFLYQFSRDEKLVYNTHEWCSPGTESLQHVIQDFPAESLQWVQKFASKRKVIHIPDIEAMPAEAEAERKELLRQGVKSLVAVPLKKGRVFLGYFGFYAMNKRIDQNSEKAEMAQIMANILADALIKNNMEIELHQSNLDLARLSATDKLTQLYNRLKLDEVLENELARVKRNGPAFAVIIIDVDHFKTVNDDYGHHLGDQVLIGLANILRSNLRVTDTCGRWGGEEFLVIAPNSSLKNGVLAAEKLRSAVEQTIFPSGIKITCSFGVTLSGSEDSVSAILIRADEALYSAKRKGRNRVESVVKSDIKGH
jgi:diguanylate cyclase